MDITPPVGVELSGGAFGRSTGVRTPLGATSLYLQQGDVCVLLISCDLVGFDVACANEIRRRISGATGVLADAVLLACTHTHNGPATATYRNWGRPDYEYRQTLADRLVQLAIESTEAPVAARVGSGWSVAPGVAVNRTFTPDGPVDERVRVLRVETEAGEPLAAVVGFGCHPVNEHSSGQISADFPGELRQALRGDIAADLPVLFVMGAAGDVLPANYEKQPDVEAAKQTAAHLANAAAEAWRSVTVCDDALLAYSARTLQAALEPLPPTDELESLAKQNDEAMKGMDAEEDRWKYTSHKTRSEWAREALKAHEQEQSKRHAPITLQGVRVGDVGFVAMPGELFAEFGIAMAERSPLAVAWPLTQVNGSVGYLPSRAAFDLDSYEATKCFRYIGLRNFAAGVGELVTDEAVALLGDLARAEENAASRQTWDVACNVIVGGGQAHKRPVKYLHRGGPAFAARAEGCRFWDVDGRPYIDYLLGYGPILLGHAHPEVRAAAAKQMADGTIYSVEHPQSVALAKRLCELIPLAESVVYFVGGSSATTGAIRCARAHTKREKIVRCGYHGWLDWAFANEPGVPLGERELILSTTYGDADALEETLKGNRDEVAGVIIEAVQNDGPPSGYFEHVRELCDEHGVVFILDEVKTGFRFDLGGAQKLYGIQPDLSTFGKAMCNGFPASVLVGSREVLGPRSDTFMAATFHADPVSLAAAEVVIDVMQREDGIARLHRAGHRLMDGMNQVFEETSLPMEVVGHPAMPTPRECQQPREASVAPRYPGQALSSFCAAMQRRGAYVTGHVWFLCLAHDDEAIEQTLDIARQAATDACEEISGAANRSAPTV